MFLLHVLLYASARVFDQHVSIFHYLTFTPCLSTP